MLYFNTLKFVRRKFLFVCLVSSVSLTVSEVSEERRGRKEAFSKFPFSLHPATVLVPTRTDSTHIHTLLLLLGTYVQRFLGFVLQEEEEDKN